MRKITFLLLSLLCSLVATAQTAITSIDELSNSKVYYLQCARGFVDTKDASIFAYDASALTWTPNSKFAIYKSDTDKYYLYNVGKSMFVSSSAASNGSLALKDFAEVHFKVNTGSSSDYPFYFTAPESGNYLNIDGGRTVYLNSWSYLDDGNQFAILEVEDLSETTLATIKEKVATYETTVNVTYNYTLTVGDKTKNLGTEEKSGLHGGIAVPAPSLTFPFVSIDSYTNQGGNLTTDAEQTIEVSCSQNLPFNVSDDTSTYWYAMDIHANDPAIITPGVSSFFVKCNEKSDGVSTVTSSSEDVKNFASNESVSDNYLWKITGSLIDGFKVTSKLSGLSLYKANGNECADVTATSEGSTFFIVKSAITDSYIPNVGNAICLYVDGDLDGTSQIYLNHRDGAGVLKGWKDNDGGSSVIFRPASSFPITYCTSKGYKDMIATASAPEGALGTSSYKDWSTLQTALTTLESDPFDEEATATLITQNAAIDAAEKVEIPSDMTGYYRLVNKNSYENYAKYYLNYQSGNVMDAESTPNGITSVVYFASNGTSGQYTAQIEGLYFGQIKERNNVNLLSADATDTKAAITFSYDGAEFVLTDVSHSTNDKQSLHLNGAKAIGWGTAAGGSKWYLIPAEDVQVSLNNANNKAYATAYLPFPVSEVSGATAYVGKTLSGNVLTVEETNNGVNANQGIVLVSESSDEGQTATLTIGNSETASAILTGTNVPVSATADGTYLVFGREDGNLTNVGFFKPNEAKTIPCNRAYIYNASSNAVRLSFGETTGIEDALVVENGEVKSNAPVFDLTGRRVMNAAKGGVYIQNGKKFIVK